MAGSTFLGLQGNARELRLGASARRGDLGRRGARARAKGSDHAGRKIRRRIGGFAAARMPRLHLFRFGVARSPRQSADIPGIRNLRSWVRASGFEPTLTARESPVYLDRSPRDPVVVPVGRTGIATGTFWLAQLARPDPTSNILHPVLRGPPIIGVRIDVLL